MSNNSLSKYLIYNCWTVLGSHGGIIGGSHLYDALIMTEDEAKAAVTLYEARHNEFEKQYPSLAVRTSRFCYIENKAEWWSAAQPVKVASQPKKVA